MKQEVEVNQGEVKISFNNPVSGKVSLAELGVEDSNLVVDGGFLRLRFELGKEGENHFFSMPTVEISYLENVSETHWQCEFNGEVILDKLDHHGKSTVILLNRDKLESLQQRHENTLIIHAEFPESVHVDPKNSFVQLFK